MKCKQRFEASDGTLFDTCKGCTEYENRPHLWLVMKVSSNHSRIISSYREEVISMFLTYKEAKSYIMEAKDLHTIKRFSIRVPDTDPAKVSLWQRIKDRLKGDLK